MGSKAFFSFKSPYAGGFRGSVGNGFTTALQRNHNGFAVCLPAPSLRGRAGGEAVVLLISECKVTTFPLRFTNVLPKIFYFFS